MGLVTDVYDASYAISNSFLLKTLDKGDKVCSPEFNCTPKK